MTNTKNQRYNNVNTNTQELESEAMHSQQGEQVRGKDQQAA